MALIQCPDCGKEVSDQAAHCNQCGRPMSSESTGSERQQRVTTQATGRTVKAHQLFGVVAIIVGIGLIAGADTGSSTTGFGALIALIGVVWVIGARFMGWWRYG